MSRPPHFDRSEAIARAGDDEELMRELLDLFLGQRAELMTAIEDAVDALDPLRIEQSAHALKGSLLALAADHASQLAQALERTGRSGDVACARDRYVELERAMNELSNVFRAELDRAA